jgi:hypothetical protein
VAAGAAIPATTAITAEAVAEAVIPEIPAIPAEAAVVGCDSLLGSGAVIGSAGSFIRWPPDRRKTRGGRIAP